MFLYFINVNNHYLSIVINEKTGIYYLHIYIYIYI
jgi:hypothetical protein